MKTLFRTAVGVLAVAFSASAAHAQATRTWVSGVGDDANPCSRTAPCKTFAGAISKTAAGGEIDALDPGGFGAVTITKAITIDGGGSFASVLAALTNGIIISNTIPSTAVVTLRNLSINGVGNGINGIRMLGGAALYVENCRIMGFTGNGIDAEPNVANAKLFVSDTIVSNNAGSAVLVKPVSPNLMTATLDNVRLEQSQAGLRVEDNGNATLTRSEASGNMNNGVNALSSLGSPVNVSISHSTLANNDNVGVRASGAGVTVRLADSTITRNQTGLSPLAGAAIISFGNNYNAGNTSSDGAPTSTVGPQ